MVKHAQVFYKSGENPYYLDLVEWNNGARFFVHNVVEGDPDMYGGGLLGVSPNPNDEPYEVRMRVRADHCKLITQRISRLPWPE